MSYVYTEPLKVCTILVKVLESLQLHPAQASLHFLQCLLRLPRYLCCLTCSRNSLLAPEHRKKAVAIFEALQVSLWNLGQ